MEIKEMKLEDLIEYEHNPRIIHDDAVVAVANSIKEFGFKVPIIVDSNNTIVAGHTRKRAAEFLGLKAVPTIVASDLSEEQIKAFRLADNKVSEFSMWDDDLLREELDKLSKDMELFGFDEADKLDLDELFDDVDTDEEESNNYIRWGNKKVYASEQDLDQLNELLKRYEEEGADVTFLTYILND